MEQARQGAGDAADVQDDPSGTGEPKTKLARRVGPVMLLLFIVGDMLGGGIYTLVGEVGGEVGGRSGPPSRPRSCSPH